MVKVIKEKIGCLAENSTLRTNLIILLSAAAVLLIILSDGSCAAKKNTQEYSTQFSHYQYAADLEKQLEAIISSVDGAGPAQVMITLQNSSEYVYASEDALSTDSSESTDSAGRQSSGERQDIKSNYIIIDTDHGEQALIRTELMPTVSGVVVVCSGAGDPGVAERIMSVVTTALDISPKRVCITQLSQ